MSENLYRFRVVRHDPPPGLGEGSLVLLHDGRATISLSPDDAKALSRGLLVVASGAAELATTELALRLEAEEAERRNRTRTTATPTERTSRSDSALARPKLENL